MHALPGCIYRDELHCRGVEISTSNVPWTRWTLGTSLIPSKKKETLILDDTSEIYWRLFLYHPNHHLLYSLRFLQNILGWGLLIGFGTVDMLWSISDHENQLLMLTRGVLLVFWRGWQRSCDQQNPGRGFFCCYSPHYRILCTVSLVFFLISHCKGTVLSNLYSRMSQGLQTLLNLHGQETPQEKDSRWPCQIHPDVSEVGCFIKFHQVPVIFSSVGL